MAERRSEGSEGRPGSPGRPALDPVPPAGTTAPAYTPEETSDTDQAGKAAHIERNIAHTRAEMSETINAIEYKLSPERLKEKAKDTVNETIDELRDRLDPMKLATQAGRTMLDTIKEHPIPSLVAGLSVGWLLYQRSQAPEPGWDYDDQYEYGSHRGRRGDGRTYGRPYRSAFRGPGYGRPGRPDQHGYDASKDSFEDSGQTGYDRAGRLHQEDDESDQSLKDRAAEKVGSVKAQAGHLKDQAQHQAEHLKDQAQHAAHQLQEGAEWARSGLHDFINSNPLAAGAIAVGVGALIGTLLPETEQENRLMGSASEAVVARGKETVSEAAETAKQVVKKTADQASESLKEVKDTAVAEAKRVKDTAATEAKQATNQGSTSTEAENTNTSRNPNTLGNANPSEKVNASAQNEG